MDNPVSHICELQMPKPKPGGRSELHADHEHIDTRWHLVSRLVEARKLMLTPDYLTTSQSEECPWAHHISEPSLSNSSLHLSRWGTQFQIVLEFGLCPTGPHGGHASISKAKGDHLAAFTSRENLGINFHVINLLVSSNVSCFLPNIFPQISKKVNAKKKEEHIWGSQKMYLV